MHIGTDVRACVVRTSFNYWRTGEYSDVNLWWRESSVELSGWIWYNH